MRYIDFPTFQPSAAWLARAKAASDALEKKRRKHTRLAFIDSNSQIWRDLREEMIQKFGSRCWFTDAEETVAPLDTEHFRPKSKSVERDNTEHEGYWWLAFDFENLRLAGQIPNRQHKRCYFPLQAGSPRASSAYRHWQEELPMFLDPIRLSDVLLVGYDEAGKMCPSKSAITAIDKERVELTDKLLGLSVHQPLREARQRVWSACRDIIRDIEKLKIEERDFGRTPRIAGEHERLCRELRGKTLPSEPFSSVAKSCLEVSGYAWAERLIAT